MSAKLFEQIITSFWFGTALFAIAIALWVIAFKLSEKRSTRSSKASR